MPLPPPKTNGRMLKYREVRKVQCTSLVPFFCIIITIIIIIIIIIIMSVPPKGRSFTASAGTKIAVLHKAGLPLQNQEPRLQFCTKAGLPPQTQEPRLQLCRRQVFHRKLSNQGCSFIRDE